MVAPAVRSIFIVHHGAPYKGPEISRTPLETPKPDSPVGPGAGIHTPEKDKYKKPGNDEWRREGYDDALYDQIRPPPSVPVYDILPPPERRH